MSKREITVEKFKHRFEKVMFQTKLDVVDIVIALEKMDPSKNLQYVPWLAKQLINEQFKLEDTARVKTVLENFDKLKPRMEQRDINQYRYHELAKVINDLVQPVIGEKEAKKYTGTFPVVGNTKVLYNGPYGQLAIPKTAQAARLLGAGTQWCTTQKEHFESYNSSGPLHVWRDRNGRKFQFQITKHQYHIDIHNARDEIISPDAYKKFLEHPVVGQILKEQEAKILERMKKSAQVGASSAFAGPGGFGFAGLGGYRRVVDPVQQAEIDRVYQLTQFVLAKTGINIKHVKSLRTYPGGFDGFCQDALAEEWAKIEPWMAKGPRSSLEYAQHVKKGRWIEQEPLIAKHAVSWTMYSREILGTNNMTKTGRTQRDKMRKEVLKTVGIKLTAKMKKLPQW
jgi:hypothetical protein